MCQRALENLLGSLLAAWLVTCVDTRWHEAVSFLRIWHPYGHGAGIPKAIGAAVPEDTLLASQWAWRYPRAWCRHPNVYGVCILKGSGAGVPKGMELASLGAQTIP